MPYYSSNFMTAIIASLALLVITMANCPVRAAEAIRFLQPATAKSYDSDILSRSSEDAEPYIRRNGEVFLSAKDLFVRESVAGRESMRVTESLSQQELQISFFPGQDIRIAVDSESESRHGILSVTGHRTSAALSTFSLTITADTYLITFQNLDSGMIYKVVGDMNTGAGRVTEYDLAQLPPVFDEPPIIPPQD